jgi:hypothetical protein
MPPSQPHHLLPKVNLESVGQDPSVNIIKVEHGFETH